MNGMHPRFSPCSVGVANLATRSFRDNGGRCMESAAATSPWLPPGGSCHDEISASRNRYFVVTDEGWRWLKVSDFHVGWRKPGHIPSIQLHSLTNLSPPLISLATLSSFPPGEAKAAAPLGSPSWRPLQGAGKTIGLQQPTKYTPSEREPRRLRRLRVAKLATPTERVQTGFCVVLNRAVQKPNVWRQVRCVIVRRRCRPM